MENNNENQVPENGDLENVQNLSLSSANLPPSHDSSNAAVGRQRSLRPRETPAVARISRHPRRPVRPPAEEEIVAVPAPLPWAGERRCSIHTQAHLIAENINTINGEVLCRKCGGTYKVEYDLQEKFSEIKEFVHEHVVEMRQRAHKAWMEPSLLKCQLCKEESCVGPKMPDKKKWINWLFLLLGQMLGFCDVGQLRYFCKHNGNTRTGSKNMLLFRVYLALCRQLIDLQAFNHLIHR